MSLHNPPYLLFLFCLVAIYYIFPWHKTRIYILLIGSYCFYTFFDYRFALILAALTYSNHILAKCIHTSHKPRPYYISSILFNLGALGFFKYFNFFLANITSLDSSPALQILLPIGISFYSFQSISYTTEIYRGKLSPVSLTHFALYLAFFPKLIAGPFVRPAQFFAQLEAPLQPPNPAQVGAAIRLFIIGLFKKIIIADSLAILSDTAFRAARFGAQADAFPAPLFWQGFYLYAIMIYADFSGYTDLARASSAFFNFELPENFKQPYFATQISDFWNRWHMSLTQWFREYIFFPLSRKWLSNTGRKYMMQVQITANLVTMLLIGFWHGASWTYIVWGLWHGILLSIERIINWKPNSRLQIWLSGLLTFHLVGIGWIFFRAANLPEAFLYLNNTFALDGLVWLPRFVLPVLLSALFILALDLRETITLHWPRLITQLTPILITGAIVTLTIIQLLAATRGNETNPFIYGIF